MSNAPPAVTELLTALETRLNLARSKAQLLAFRVELAERQDDPEQAQRYAAEAEEARSNLLAWELAGQSLREAIRINAETREMLTGWPVKPERPTLKVVDGADTPDPPPAA